MGRKTSWGRGERETFDSSLLIRGQFIEASAKSNRLCVSLHESRFLEEARRPPASGDARGGLGVVIQPVNMVSSPPLSCNTWETAQPDADITARSGKNDAQKSPKGSTINKSNPHKMLSICFTPPRAPLDTQTPCQKIRRARLNTSWNIEGSRVGRGGVTR